ncbi:MAG TPA: hypothetical protein GXX19_08110 [Syntrophomonadaceae bacterium]|nr:hypothetical protein [Syntrophomonadaceae bacterium]
MAKREFEVIITRSGSQDEREQAYREAIRFLLFRLTEQSRKSSQVLQCKVGPKDGQGR